MQLGSRLFWGHQPPDPLAAYLLFHVLLLQNTRPGRRTDVRPSYSE